MKYVQLLTIALQTRKTAEAMTGDQLDTWYEANVGYKPTQDDPRITPAELTAMVAGSMFFRAMPDGLETPGAEEMEQRMSRAILGGQLLLV